MKTTFSMHCKDILNQVYTERLKLEVNDHGQKRRFVSEEDLKYVFPQEFKALVKLQQIRVSRMVGRN